MPDDSNPAAATESPEVEAIVEHDATIQEDGLPASLLAEREADASLDADSEDDEAPEKAPPSMLRRAVMTLLKVAVSAGGLYLVYGNALGRDGLEELQGHIDAIRWPWFAAAAGMQLTAIAFAIVRWRILLGGQGIRARWSFLAPSFMIGRFWGAFTPGGLGLDGWRLYDVATHSDKPARAVAVTVTEKILGQLAFGLVVMGASFWGLEMMGTEGVLMVNGFFVVLVTAGLTFLARPALFMPLFRLLPAQVLPRLVTLIDAVTGYRGKWKLLAIAVLCGGAVHAFNNMIYVCAAQAMNLPLTPTVVFFASSLVIMSTLIPLSLNGVGLREATAAGVLGAFGVAPPLAAATFTLGWIAEMCVSAIGLPIYLLRRATYDAKLVIDDAEREDQRLAELEEVPFEETPTPLGAAAIGAPAGLLAGMLVGLAEAGVILADSGGQSGYAVLAYGAIAYGIFCAVGGAFAAIAVTWLGLRLRLEGFNPGWLILRFAAWLVRFAGLLLRAWVSVTASRAFARWVGIICAGFAFALSAFRIRRDVFNEELVWKSKEGGGLLLACLVASAVLYFLLSTALRIWTSSRAGRFLLTTWGSPVFVALLIAGAFGGAMTLAPEAEANVEGQPSAPIAGAPNVLVIVVDTLRADHLPVYGYRGGDTPALDRFAEDSVRYDQAFSNSSWTRPSFASILTGRHASSHGVMAKGDALPDDVTTLPEALYGAGYATGGIVTNFNVGRPTYNFGQGFEDFRFLEPRNVLWADDTSSQLLLIQGLRRGIEGYRARQGIVQVDAFYQDAEVVNGELMQWLDAAPTDRPWFSFVGYMDPHDPYFPHPYDGTGYSRAAHQHPDLAEAAELRDLYDGEITYWDAQFGALMDDLRRRGLYDDMMIVVTADHGEEFGEHGGFWHGTTLYDEQVHVPLLVKMPRNQRAGTHVSHWVQSIDLMPSILREVGVDIPDGVQGGQLEEGTDRVFAEESHEGNMLESVRERRDFEEFKLITANAGNPRGLEPVELYRVADDVGEQTNAADSEREQVRALLTAMDEARRDAAEGAVEAQEAERNEEDLRMQCSLGYADPTQCCERGYLSGPQCRGT